MSSADFLVLQLKVWFVRLIFYTTGCLRILLGKTEYTKFLPQRIFSIPSTTSARKIRINVYEPKNFDKNKRYPVRLNFHGSGFMISMLGTDGDFCHLVSQRAGAIVLDCDYAKSPEYPFPAAPNDVRDIVAHVTANREGYFDVSRITIGGFSAGGTLALTAGVDQPKGTLKGVVVFYPCVDLSLNTAIQAPPPVSEGNTNPIPPWFNKLVSSSYTPHGTDMNDPRLSPVNTPSTTLPEHVLMIVCAEDPLQYDAVEYAKRLKKEGVKIILKELAKVVHAWDKTAQEGTLGGIAKRDSYEAAAGMLKLIYEYGLHALLSVQYSFFEP
ncbi:alpha/beta hydrolase fold protein [Rhizoctonia solani AG-3 Rhs1AP]|uniref:Alpha/beta hydrolase fold protein n=1 Tax=Rhizoctonia solani AG-3 Rhs1AP TaxID=1086054 RepID=X8J617_9AGAM|nr:alpha/beta hydrolase fold protein [Rhizoctonia solani AG-3 Rhs1AP]